MRDADALSILSDVVFQHGIHKSVRRREATSHRKVVYDHTVGPRLKALDQRYTGKCWAFAGLNVLRRNVCKQLRLKEDSGFCLSTSFLTYHDKLEKALSFLQKIADLAGEADECKRERVLYMLMQRPVQDGGTWHGFVNLVTKYGVVPYDTMPNSFVAQDTENLNHLLNLLLRRTARAILTGTTAGRCVEQAIGTVRRLLDMTYGRPPQSFVWKFSDCASRNHVLEATPREMFLIADRGVNIRDHVLLVDHPLYDPATRFHVEYQDTVTGDSSLPNEFVNTPPGCLHTMATAAIRAGFAVWCACEWEHLYLCGRLLHTDAMAVERLVGDVSQSREERLLSRQVNVAHAVLCTSATGDGSHVEVENSHGSPTTDESRQEDGYLDMHKSWFDEHVFMIAVPRRFCVLPPSPLVVLPPWDVLGDVAVVK